MEILKEGKSNELFNEFIKFGDNLTRMSKDWPSGCVYDKGTEFRINDEGKIQFRVCRRVYHCDDNSFNHGWECGDWKNY